MKRRYALTLLTTFSLFGAATSVFADEFQIEYPHEYRSWTHIKSMVIQKGHGLYEAFGGIHHIYANQKALSGYDTGIFPDGSIIVFDLLRANSDNNAIVEGSRKILGVMVKDKLRFPDTGGWGFEGFTGGDPSQPAVGGDASSACFQCHTARADRDYVFSDRKQ